MKKLAASACVYSIGIGIALAGDTSPQMGPTNVDWSQGIPAPWNSSHPGGWDAAAAAAAGNRPRPKTGGASIQVTAVKTVDGNDNPLTVTPGVPFWVEVDWEYDNPSCTNYTVQRVVNGWTNVTPSFNWGCGYAGATYWDQYWGAWLIYKAGTYPISVTVDPGNAITGPSSTKSMTINLTVGGTILPQWALIDAEFGRTNLSPGTDVIVGSMDDAFDFLHPWFSGNDSRGRPRLVAAVENDLGPDGSPTNDVHDTGVMGIVLARGANNGDLTGLAPDARYVIAEFLNRANVPNLPELNIIDAANVLMTNGAEILNMPWSYWIGSDTDSETGEAPISALMADYLAYASNSVVVAYVNELTSPTIPTAPGSARNVITVGGLDSNLTEAWPFDNYGPTLDGRCKPDILGDSATNCIAPSWEWRDGFPAASGYWGNSFAGPFVTGAAAQMLGYAKQHALNRDHRLIKALIMNSGVTALDDNGAGWTSTETSPLDAQQGTGILNMQRVYAMYSAGQQTSGPVTVPGYDCAIIQGTNQPGLLMVGSTNGMASYRLGSPATATADLDVTLAWDRPTFWDDVNGNGQIDSADTFFVNTNTHPQNILQLVLFSNSVEVAESRSVVDTIQHLHLTGLAPAAYELQVERLAVPNAGSGETYGLAWYSSVPWANLPPKVVFTSARLGADDTATLQFQLASGQAGNFQLQGATNLVPPVNWTAVPNAPFSQIDTNLFQLQVNLGSGRAHFFRLSAAP
ncbi:MAG TPA: S8 family serine peptidase [Candidatus Acidoferrales bacterium]|nr:S8 family serine peptidase [Candidatus Acidoferrales bacterium]